MPISVDFGVNTPAVLAYFDRLRRLTPSEAAAIRRAYLQQAAELGPESAPRRAAALSRIIRAAVDFGRREAHSAAVQAGQTAVAASGARDAGIGVFLADLGGTLVVRDLITQDDFNLMAGGWLAAIGGDLGD